MSGTNYLNCPPSCPTITNGKNIKYGDTIIIGQCDPLPCPPGGTGPCGNTPGFLDSYNRAVVSALNSSTGIVTISRSTTDRIPTFSFLNPGIPDDTSEIIYGGPVLIRVNVGSPEDYWYIRFDPSQASNGKIHWTIEQLTWAAFVPALNSIVFSINQAVNDPSVTNIQSGADIILSGYPTGTGTGYPYSYTGSNQICEITSPNLNVAMGRTDLSEKVYCFDTGTTIPYCTAASGTGCACMEGAGSNSRWYCPETANTGFPITISKSPVTMKLSSVLTTLTDKEIPFAGILEDSVLRVYLTDDIPGCVDPNNGGNGGGPITKKWWFWALIAGGVLLFLVLIFALFFMTKKK